MPSVLVLSEPFGALFGCASMPLPSPRPARLKTLCFVGLLRICALGSSRAALCSRFDMFCVALDLFHPGPLLSSRSGLHQFGLRCTLDSPSTGPTYSCRHTPPRSGLAASL